MISLKITNMFYGVHLNINQPTKIIKDKQKEKYIKLRNTIKRGTIHVQFLSGLLPSLKI